jgi:hypothetical protein
MSAKISKMSTLLCSNVRLIRPPGPPGPPGPPDLLSGDLYREKYPQINLKSLLPVCVTDCDEHKFLEFQQEFPAGIHPEN